MKTVKKYYKTVVALLQVLALKAIFGKQIAGEMILAWGKYQQALSRQALNDVKKRQRKGSRKNKNK